MARRNTWEFIDVKVTDLPLSVGQSQSPAIKASAETLFATRLDNSVGHPSKIAMRAQY
jgi:hypothetical protein